MGGLISLLGGLFGGGSGGGAGGMLAGGNPSMEGGGTGNPLTSVLAGDEEAEGNMAAGPAMPGSGGGGGGGPEAQIQQAAMALAMGQYMRHDEMDSLNNNNISSLMAHLNRAPGDPKRLGGSVGQGFQNPYVMSLLDSTGRLY